MSEHDTTTITNEEIAAKLREFGATEEVIERVKLELGVENIDDLIILTESDLLSAGFKTVQARKFLASLKAPEPVANEAVNPNSFGPASFTNYEGILPMVPDDESWLKSLKAGGVLKVDQSSIIAAMRAALAFRVGLFDIPGKLVVAMEKFADDNENPVEESYFAISKQITRHSYAEVFSAIDGLNGEFVTERRKKQLFDRMNQYLFPAISDFYVALKNWQENWLQGASNPAFMMYTLMNRGSSLLSGMVQSPPDTGVLKDSADAVNNAINKTFSGMGMVISTALAYDATQIRDTLQNPKLPALIGAANRDQMLKMIGANINPTYPRLETNLIRFILGVLQVSDQTAGEEEVQYFSALAMLGSQIQFEQLGIESKGITGINGNKL